MQLKSNTRQNADGKEVKKGIEREIEREIEKEIESQRQRQNSTIGRTQDISPQRLPVDIYIRRHAFKCEPISRRSVQ
jgi:hypothetical protein